MKAILNTKNEYYSHMNGKEFPITYRTSDGHTGIRFPMKNVPVSIVDRLLGSVRRSTKVLYFKPEEVTVIFEKGEFSKMLLPTFKNN